MLGKSGFLADLRTNSLIGGSILLELALLEGPIE